MATAVQGADGNSCSGQRLTVHVVKLGQVLQSLLRLAHWL